MVLSGTDQSSTLGGHEAFVQFQSDLAGVKLGGTRLQAAAVLERYLRTWSSGGVASNRSPEVRRSCDRFATRWSFVEMLLGLETPGIVPSNSSVLRLPLPSTGSRGQSSPVSTVL